MSSTPVITVVNNKTLYHENLLPKKITSPDAYTDSAFIVSQTGTLAGVVESPVDLQDWVLESSDSEVKWHILGTTLAYSDDNFSSYYTGSQPNDGTAVSGPLQISDLSNIISFSLKLDIEQTSNFDIFRLEVLSTSNVVLLSFFKNTTFQISQDFITYSLDMSSLIGQTVKFRFFFDTVDQYQNTNSGIFINNIVLKGQQLGVPGYTTVTPLTPGSLYLIECDAVDNQGVVYPRVEQVSIPAGVLDEDGRIVAAIMPKMPSLLESLTLAVGKVVQSLGGVPTCRAVSDCIQSDRLVFVNSTLGFPKSGFFITPDGFKVEYSDKCDTAFLLAQSTPTIISAGDALESDVKSIPARRQS